MHPNYDPAQSPEATKTDKPCNDCGVGVGQPHEDGCDVARCLWSGVQRLACDRDIVSSVHAALLKAGETDLAEHFAYWQSLDAEDLDHDCGDDVWTGEWPGDADARRLDLWSYWGPDYGGRGWVPCEKEHPGARPDLNRLAMRPWDRELQRFE